MGALQMSPLVLEVGALPRGVSRRVFLSPSFAEFAAIRSHVLSLGYVELMAVLCRELVMPGAVRLFDHPERQIEFDGWLVSRTSMS
jgi:hypothetical protein